MGLTPGADRGATRLAAARSFLFVPGDRPERFDKALAAGADIVIVDLEDAVAPERKALARAALRRWLSPERPVLLRINAASTEALVDDLPLCPLPGVAGVVLAKTETVADLAQVQAAAPAVALLPLVETGLGLHNAALLAGSPGVVRLVFGTIDFRLDLGIPEEGEAMAPFRAHLVLASRLGRCAAPVDGVSTALDDGPALRADVAQARRFGFGGKLCIHPRQIAAVQEGFAPTEAEADWARRILAHVRDPARAEQGAIALDGQMIDRPVVLRAEAILRRLGRG